MSSLKRRAPFPHLPLCGTRWAWITYVRGAPFWGAENGILTVKHTAAPHMTAAVAGAQISGNGTVLPNSYAAGVDEKKLRKKTEMKINEK